MKYRITHRTTYIYAQPVTVSQHAARVFPLHMTGQSCSRFQLHITPDPSRKKSRVDYFGNTVFFFSIQEIHHELEITSVSEVEVTIPPCPKPPDSPPFEEVLALFRDPVSPDQCESYQYVFDSPFVRGFPELADYAAKSFPKGTPLMEGVFDLNHRIHTDFEFDSKATTISTPLEEVWENRRGVCQDFAHLGIACMRSLGLPARYVSGYLRTHPPAGKPRLVGADASHAWFSVYCPQSGWVDFDPTNDVIPAFEHIRVAYGRDFSDVSPVMGIVTGGGKQIVRVGVDVEPLGESTPLPAAVEVPAAANPNQLKLEI